MTYKIPPLDCLWNDVFQLTAIEPRTFKNALREASKNFYDQTMSFFKIDPTTLDPKFATVYTHDRSEKTAVPQADDFVAYDPTKLQPYSVLPNMSMAYYKRIYALGKKPRLFVGVPHIFYKGSIDISKAEIVTV